LGEEQWKRALNHYLKTHAYGNVETNDLQQAIQDKLGIDMSWFFDQWILRDGEPQYTVHYEDLMGKDGSRHTEIAIEQTHQRDEVIGFFKMPIAFEVHYTDGSFERVVDMIQYQFEVVKIPNKDKKEIAFVLFDPNSMVMKTVNFKKSYNELKAQVIHAPNMLDRYDALVALKDYDVEQKRELLMEVFRNEKFHAMKSEVITQLINDEVTNYQLLSVFNEKEPQAKLTFIKAYNGNNTFCVSAIAKALTDNSYDVVQAAIEKICKIDAVNVKMYLPIVKEVYGMNNSVNIKYHELGVIYNIDADEHAKVLINYASNQWEFRTRNNAFAAIKSSGVYSAALIPHLFDAMLNTNSRLAGPAAELTNFLATKTTNLNDMQHYFNTTNYTKAQKDILIKYVPGLK